MSLPPGTALAPYEILAPIGAGGLSAIGAGGMGEVYVAEETKGK